MLLLRSRIMCAMKEPGEQCTVVFALIVTYPASDCERLWREEEGVSTPLSPSLPRAGSVQFMQRRQCIVLQVPPCCMPKALTFLLSDRQPIKKRCCFLCFWITHIESSHWLKAAKDKDRTPKIM
jgi:hypothetical protein